MKDLSTEIKKLNPEQLKVFISLVKLGDSEELALKTASEIHTSDDSMYKFAYLDLIN